MKCRGLHKHLVTKDSPTFFKGDRKWWPFGQTGDPYFKKVEKKVGLSGTDEGFMLTESKL